MAQARFHSPLLRQPFFLYSWVSPQDDERRYTNRSIFESTYYRPRYRIAGVVMIDGEAGAHEPFWSSKDRYVGRIIQI